MANINNTERYRKQFWLMKSDIELKKVLDDLIDYRRKNGLDKRDMPYGELVKASFRFEPLIDILKKAEIKRNNEKKYK